MRHWRTTRPVPAASRRTGGRGLIADSDALLVGHQRWADLVADDLGELALAGVRTRGGSELDAPEDAAPAGGAKSGRPLARPVSGARTGSVRALLEIEPGLWWLGWREGRLVVEVTRVESYVDSAGVVWAVVEGWRRLTGGGRCWSRDLVRPAALPPELLASPDAHCSARPRGESA